MEARAVAGDATRASLTEGALDSLDAQIAVVAVNEAWRRFPEEAGAAGGDCVGRSYLERAALELSGGEPRDDVALLVAVVEP